MVLLPCCLFRLAVVLLLYVIASVVLFAVTRNSAGGLQRYSNGNIELIKSLFNNIKVRS